MAGPSRREVVGAGLAALTFGGVRPALADFTYALAATPVAPDTYVVYGARELFTPGNGGNIVNTAFVDTADGAVLIDTGSCRRYGEALRALVERTCGKPIVRIYVTHHHPDHFLGNQAFPAERLASLPQVIRNIAAEGNGFADALYKILGDWMSGTEVTLPTVMLGQEPERFGRHRFTPIALAGHTSADLALLDEQTGVLFAGDLAFLDRALTTPHADLDRWRSSLRDIQSTGHTLIVQGHGPIEPGDRAIRQTRDYLDWLDRLLTEAVKSGLGPIEAMELPIPVRFRQVALTREELRRSVVHLFAGYDEALLPVAPADASSN